MEHWPVDREVRSLKSILQRTLKKKTSSHCGTLSRSIYSTAIKRRVPTMHKRMSSKILIRRVSICITEKCEMNVDMKNAQKSRFNQAPRPATKLHITRRNAENRSTEAHISTTDPPSQSEDQIVRCGSRAWKRSIQGMDKLLSSGQEARKSMAVPYLWSTLFNRSGLVCSWSARWSPQEEKFEKTMKKNCSESFWYFGCHQEVQKQN